MKNYFLLLSAILFITVCYAQDTIHKRSGEIILAKISELTPTEVKYKRFDFQDGPVYIESKSNIESIKYSNGLKETFKKEDIVKPKEAPAQNDYYAAAPTQNNKISTRGSSFFHKGQFFNEREIQDILLDTKNKQIMAYVVQSQKAKKMKYIGFGAIPLGVAGLIAIASSTTYSYYGTPKTDEGLVALGAFCIVGAVACPITGGIYHKKKKDYTRRAIKLYNETY